MSITINESKEKIKELVDKFDFNIQQYKNKNYDDHKLLILISKI